MSKITTKTLKKINDLVLETYEDLDDGDITETQAKIKQQLLRTAVLAHTEDRLRNGKKLRK